MKTTYLFSIFLGVVLFASCGGCGDVCPPDEKVGELDLDQEVLDFIPYDGTERLVFKNQNGDSLLLFSDNGKEVSQDRLCIKEICTEPEIKGETTCEYFESESHRFIFRNDEQDALMDFLVFSELIRSNTELFRQSIRLSWNFKSTLFATGERVLKIIPDTPVGDDEIDIQVEFEEIGAIELNGKTYSDVFKADDLVMDLYFNISEGLVGFETADEVWNLENR